LFPLVISWKSELGREYRSDRDCAVLSVPSPPVASPWSAMAIRPAQAGAAALVPPTWNQPDWPS
jgi:hypothetical protein